VKPYFEDGGGRVLYCGDCREVLPTFQAGSVDLVLTDPPYFRVKDEWWDRQWDTQDGFVQWLGDLCREWRRVLRPNGSLYVFASPDMAARVECRVRDYFRVLNRIRWVKEAGWHNRAEKEALRSYLSPWEEIVFAEQYGAAGITPIGDSIRAAREKAGVSRSDLEVALGYASTKEPGRGTALCYRWEEGACIPSADDYCRALQACGDAREYDALRREYDALRREYDALRRPFRVTDRTSSVDVWDYQPVMPYPGKHPCEKPLTLISHMIEASTLPGAVVLDCCAGSGTTLRAAKDMGLAAVGVEVDERWCEVIARRLRQEVLPGFNEVPA
jgi:adenine-specific DNA-methyltransferase